MIGKKTLTFARITHAVFLLIFAYLVLSVCVKNIDQLCTTIVQTQNGYEARMVLNSKAIPTVITIALVWFGMVASVMRVFVNKLWISIISLIFVSCGAIIFMSLDLRLSFALVMKDHMSLTKGFKIANTVCGVFSAVAILDAVSVFALELMTGKKK